MKVRFIGNPSDPADETKVCTAFGRDFFRGIETDVSDLDEHARKKLAGNSHFELTERDGAFHELEPEPKRKPGRPRTIRPDDDGGIDGDVREV